MQYPLFGDALPVTQLIFYHGIALAVTVLLAGILMTVLNGHGSNRRIISSPQSRNDPYIPYRHTSFYSALLYCTSQVLSFYKLKARPSAS